MKTTNFLHIKHPDVEKAQNEVDYLYQVIKLINGFFPKGYIELQALCRELYGDKAGKYLYRLQLVGVKVMEPVLMKWTEEGASVLMNKILIPLAFVSGCYDKLTMAIYEKSYERFLAITSAGVWQTPR